jgi:hypothetical protein
MGDNLTNLTEQQMERVRQGLKAGIEAIDAGEYTEYEGREGLKRLAEKVKARGRKLLDQGSKA